MSKLVFKVSKSNPNNRWANFMGFMLVIEPTKNGFKCKAFSKKFKTWNTCSHPTRKDAAYEAVHCILGYA